MVGHSALNAGIWVRILVPQLRRAHYGDRIPYLA